LVVRAMTSVFGVKHWAAARYPTRLVFENLGLLGGEPSGPPSSTTPWGSPDKEFQEITQKTWGDPHQKKSVKKILQKCGNRIGRRDKRSLDAN